jgi:hypothetical protein
MKNVFRSPVTPEGISVAALKQKVVIVQAQAEAEAEEILVDLILSRHPGTDKTVEIDIALEKSGLFVTKRSGIKSSPKRDYEGERSQPSVTVCTAEGLFFMLLLPPVS